MHHATATKVASRPGLAASCQPRAAASALPTLTTSPGRCPCGGGCPTCTGLPASVTAVLRSPGQPLEREARGVMEARFGHDFGAVRIHTGPSAARAATAVGARAFTFGHNVVFGAGAYDAPPVGNGATLAHELAHVAQTTRLDHTGLVDVARLDHPAEREADLLAGSGGRARHRTLRTVLFRQVQTIPAARRTAAQIFGAAGPPPVAGMNLSEFRTYTQQQVDWFVEPTLSAGSARDDLWSLLLRAEKGPHILSGVGDLKVADLRTVSVADWVPLERFCQGTHSAGHTVRIFPPLPPTVAERIALGNTLTALEAIIPPAVLEVTVSDTQLLQVQTQGHQARLTQYWTDFRPHIEQSFSPTAGARGPEFDRVLSFLNSLGVGGLAPLANLKGANPDERWVRNLHRFPMPMLLRLVANLGDTTGVKRLVLVLHTGHDAPGAFQSNPVLLSDLVLTSVNNLVLMIEGATSLAAITTRIPTIRSTWGQKVAGIRRINQVVIAGHGSTQTVGMAGTGPPVVAGGLVTYPEESLVAGQANTQVLLDALLKEMPPATARILYFGCLVGATHVAPGTAAVDIPNALAASQSLAAFTNARAVAAGIPAGRVQAARASVAPGQITSLTDPAGNLQVAYPVDPNAYGSAPSYARSGREPEGVLRAAVEVGATNGNQAKTLLQTRLAMAATNDWYDKMTRLHVALALPVGPAALDLKRLNELANTAEVPFLARWPQFNITPASFVARLNPQPYAAQVYGGVATTSEYTAPVASNTQRLRLVIDQGQLALGGAALVPTLLAGVTAINMNASAFAPFLDLAVLAPHAAALLPVGPVPTQTQIRLALAWFSLDSTNVQVRNFLTAQVTHPANAPAAFSAAVSAEIAAAGRTDREILDQLGFAPTAAAPPAAPGAAPIPIANLALPGSGTNTLLYGGRPYEATVTAANAKVRNGPSDAQPVFTTRPQNSTVRVAGVQADWAAVDINGRLGFMRRADLSAPPP